MTGDKNKLSHLNPKDGGKVSFGGNQSGKIAGIGEIGPTNGLRVKDVYFVEGLCHNLLSVSQSTDKGNWVIFDSEECFVVSKEDLSLNKDKLKIKLRAPRDGNCYTVDIESEFKHDCLISQEDNHWLWHKRLAHVNMKQLEKLVNKELVTGIPKMKHMDNLICDACIKGKQTKTSFKSKKEISTNRPLELIHMDLIGPARVKSLGGSLYTLVIVDDFSRFTWTICLASKDETFNAFTIFAKKAQNEKGISIISIRTDHGGEFENQAFSDFCEENGIDHNFSAPRTPQQNGVVERKNRVLTEMARAMLNDKELSQVFWAEAINTASYISNRAYIRSVLVNSNAMDNNWRSTQGTESTMDTSSWRTQLQPDSRQRIINKIMDTLKRHLPVSGQDGLHELCKIAQRFEEKIYIAATSQSDYLREISLKMLAMENSVNPMQSNASGPSSRPIDSGIPMQSQVHNPQHSHAIPAPNNVQQSTQPMLQQHSQSVIRQQQQTSINNQQLILNSQPQQHLLAAQSNVTSVQHPQLPGQQNNVGDMQQHQRFLVGQQNNLPHLQQHQQQQQQLINQQNNLSNIHQQQLGSNVPGLQQQQQTNQHYVNMLQQSKVPVQQQSQENVTNLLQSQGPQSQPLVPQQQLMPQIQSQPAQLQQHLGLQQQPNSLQRDMQQRLQALTSLLQQQNVLDQQKQLYQSQRALPNSLSTPLDSTLQTGKSDEDDWQEEVYQKIKSLRESYLPELTEMHQKIAAKLQQHESLSHQHKSYQLGKLKMFKTMLERLIAFLQVSKVNIVPSFKEKMASYEKQIINFINTNRPRKAMSSMQPGQLPPNHVHPVSQPQSQLAQVQSHENKMNSQMQSTNLQSSVATMQQNNMASLQHNSIPSISGVSTTQQNMVNSMQPGANLNSSYVNSLQQVGASCLQQNSLNAPQQQNVLDQRKQSYKSQRTLPDSSSSSTALTGKSGGDDWQEEFYQKKKKARKSPEPPKEPVFNCPICMDPLVEEMSTRCGHIFCKSCIKAAVNAQGKCPTCRKKVSAKELIRVFLPSTG